MLVSVVIPTYNQAGYLRIALTSVVTQSYRDIEIVVIDDGSTDETRTVCESFSDARIRYVFQENDGTGGLGARNRGILEARGTWVALLDHDDRWLPEKIERQLMCAQRVPGAAAVFCPVIFINESGSEQGRQQGPLPEGDVYHFLLSHNRYYTPSAIFKRTAIAVSGLPSQSMGFSDWWLWLAIARAHPVAVCQEYLAEYRVHRESALQGLLLSATRRFADENRATLVTQKFLYPRNSKVCRKSYKEGMSMVAGLYFSAAEASLRERKFVDLWACLVNCVAVSPLWLLRYPVRAARGLLQAFLGHPQKVSQNF